MHTNTRNAGFILAVALAISLLASPANGNPPGDRSGDRGNASEEQPAPRGKSPLSATESSDRIISSVDGPNATETANDKEKADSERETQDLKAQQQMATWGKWTVIIAVIAALVGANQLFLNWRTLPAIKNTADSASAAVTAAKRDTKVAIAATRLAEKDLRAYLAFHATQHRRCSFDDAYPESVEYVIRNDGKTPATGVRHWCRIDALLHPLPEPFGFEAGMPVSGGSGFVVSPGSSHAFTTAILDINAKCRADLRGGTRRLYLWGEVAYTDALDKQRVTHFRMWFRDAPSPGDDGIWTYCDEGNEAT